eukprot:gene9029-12204_t
MAAVNQRRARRIAEDRGMFLAAPAGDARGVGGVIFGQPARDRPAIGRVDRDQVAAAEIALDTRRARGEQALAGGECGHSPGIDVDCAACRQSPG